jgi:hypothetical protein
MMEYTREQLIAICEKAIVPEEKWGNRDSASAQQKVGMAWAFLKAGVPFKVLTEHGHGNLVTDERTIWLEFHIKDFGCWDYREGERGVETTYLPTEKRLAECEGEDWY